MPSRAESIDGASERETDFSSPIRFDRARMRDEKLFVRLRPKRRLHSIRSERASEREERARAREYVVGLRTLFSRYFHLPRSLAPSLPLSPAAFHIGFGYAAAAKRKRGTKGEGGGGAMNRSQEFGIGTNSPSRLVLCFLMSDMEGKERNTRCI